MEFKFTVTTPSPELIKSEEYPLFWSSDNLIIPPIEIGRCKIQIENNEVKCTAIITTGGVRHSTNNITDSEFKASDIYADRYEYRILLKEDVNGNEGILGFCLFTKSI